METLEGGVVDGSGWEAGGVRRGWLALGAAAVLGAVAGCFELFNTGVGWHVASGRWILQHLRVPKEDPFALGGPQPWIDHEWLFQVLVATVDAVAGPVGLVVLRAALTAAVGAIVYVLGRRAGLSVWAALLLCTVCVLGARMRFFLRPELVTLTLVPLAVAAALDISDRKRRVVTMVATLVVAVNAHGAALVAVPLIAAVAAGRVLDAARAGRLDRSLVLAEAGVVAVAAASTLATPATWKLWTVPFQLTELVGSDAVPNPEWLVSTPERVPALYAAMALAGVILLARERSLARWLLLVAISVLAVRYVRNVGLFFVLLPLAVAPAAARLPMLAGALESQLKPVIRGLTIVVMVAAVGWCVLAPWPRFGFGIAHDRYPVAACDFLAEHGLLDAPLYNDVPFGGYLLWRAYPPLQVFLDDRNEIHAERLQRIWSILSASDPGRWDAFLAEHDLDVALLRYHPPLTVRGRDGREVGVRGFSALWFPPRRWALVYFDDVAMVLVRRGALTEALAKRELRWLRPDDGAYLVAGVAQGAIPAGPVMQEVRRRLGEQPPSERASELAEALLQAAQRPPQLVR
jgi:hypothetical protein